MQEQERKLTTASGRPYVENDNTMTVGPRGPVLLQDYILHENMAHFNRERIPERVVHAKGAGAYGTLTVTHDITSYTRAKLFSEVGKQTRVFVRFSTVGGEKGSADTERDPRGFAVKLYTEDGNWDLVGNNTPVFFVKDPKKFGDFIHTQKRDPRTNCKSPTMMWDFWSLNPESLHQVLILMSDRHTASSRSSTWGSWSSTHSRPITLPTWSRPRLPRPMSWMGSAIRQTRCCRDACCRTLTPTATAWASTTNSSRSTGVLLPWPITS